MAFHNITFIPIDYKELSPSIVYDKKKHDAIVKRAGALSKELGKVGMNIDVIKVSDEVSADGHIPILTSQKIPLIYKEFNNFLILTHHTIYKIKPSIFVRFSN
jgi:hypothetical protein